jgi:UPF0755 protein
MLLGVLAVLLAAGLLVGNEITPFSGPGKAVVVTVEPGDSLSKIASRLQTAGIVNSAFVFRLESLVLGSGIVVPGSYEIRQNDSFFNIKGILLRGPNVHVISVRPGLTVREILSQVAGDFGNAWAVSFLTSLKHQVSKWTGSSVNNPEGFLGAGDYIVGPSETPSLLAEQISNHFAAELKAVGLKSTSTENNLNLYQLVTAASIVEKEGYYPKNMPKVARVILNRLKLHSALQMDSTVLYYLGKDGGSVTPAMLKLPTPYNTYLHAGLTPTPICVVSEQALNSITNPPIGNWLYFVVIDKNGNEAFSSDFAQQLANEQLARSRGVA